MANLSEALLPDRKATWFEPRSAVRAAYINSVKSVFGTGLLALPSAILAVGAPAGCLLTALCGIWSIYTMQLLAWCVDAAVAAGVTPKSYGELCLHSLGRTGGLLSAGNMLVSQLACCATYLVFIGDNVGQLLGVPKARCQLCPGGWPSPQVCHSSLWPS